MPKKEMTFEEALGQLEAAVSSLEKGEMSLEESLKVYEKGVSLAAFCEKTLAAAKLKLSELQPENPEEEEEPGLF